MGYTSTHIQHRPLLEAHRLNQRPPRWTITHSAMVSHGRPGHAHRPAVEFDSPQGHLIHRGPQHEEHGLRRCQKHHLYQYGNRRQLHHLRLHRQEMQHRQNSNSRAAWNNRQNRHHRHETLHGNQGLRQLNSPAHIQAQQKHRQQQIQTQKQQAQSRLHCQRFHRSEHMRQCWHQRTTASIHHTTRGTVHHPHTL